MSYVRKGQNRKLLTFFAANLDGIPDQQIAAPEKALMAAGEHRSLDLTVRAFGTGGGGCANNIQPRTEAAAEYRGGTATQLAVPLNNSRARVAVA